MASDWAMLIVTEETACELGARLHPVLSNADSIENFWFLLAPKNDDVFGQHGNFDPMVHRIGEAWVEARERDKPKHARGARAARRLQTMQKAPLEQRNRRGDDQIAFAIPSVIFCFLPAIAAPCFFTPEARTSPARVQVIDTGISLTDKVSPGVNKRSVWYWRNTARARAGARSQRRRLREGRAGELLGGNPRDADHILGLPISNAGLFGKGFSRAGPAPLLARLAAWPGIQRRTAERRENANKGVPSLNLTECRR